MDTRVVSPGRRPIVLLVIRKHRTLAWKGLENEWDLID